MSHYFIPDPSLKKLERKLELEIFGHRFHFITNSGLFSCTEVDRASICLVQNMPPISGSLLDMGCGYGVLGIVLSKAYSTATTMVDVNPSALSYAATNTKLNNINANILQSNAFENITDKYDNIVINPPIHAGKNIMYTMYTGAVAHLNPGGALYIVILKKHGAESTIQKLKELFTQVNILYKKKGCYVVQAVT